MVGVGVRVHQIVNAIRSVIRPNAFDHLFASLLIPSINDQDLSFASIVDVLNRDGIPASFAFANGEKVNVVALSQSEISYAIAPVRYRFRQRL
jgi:hypothetical protein